MSNTIFLCSLMAFLLVTTAGGQTLSRGIDGEERPGAVTGLVTDQRGDPVGGATVLIEPAGDSTLTGAEGAFTLPAHAGSFDLAVTAPGFATLTVHGELAADQQLSLGTMVLSIQPATTEVTVRWTREELAQEQVRVEEGQRILGIIPNFLVTYDHGAVPLRSRQKYELALKTLIDPETLSVALATSGLQQRTGGLREFGTGAEGFAKRFGASYGTSSIDTMLGSAVLPSLFQQDPRYFYQGTGTVTRRALYAVSMSVMCKGDNGKWQYNYSGLLGGLAAGGLSNLYYPAANRSGLGLTFENTAIGIGSSALSNLLQEFVIKRFTRSAKH